LNLFRFQQLENYQRRSLFIRRLVGRSAAPLYRLRIYKDYASSKKQAIYKLKRKIFEFAK
jgi:hypothetical protein